MNHFPDLIESLLRKENLSEEDSFRIMKEILLANLPPVQIGAFLTALRAKDEAVEEIVGFVRAMRESMSSIVPHVPVIVDTCGTGGDRKGTFNISTAAAFVIAGAGHCVAKHGNRSVSSLCGSADILESAGVKIDVSKEKAERCLKEIGITFLFAPLYHPAMKNVAWVRRELGFRTVFNILGPLVNPAGANAQVIGVAKKEFVPLIAKTLQRLANKKKLSALVIHESGYDELVLLGRASVAELRNGQLRSYTLAPKDFGMKKIDSRILQGGDASKNARLLREILSGKGGPLEEVVVANAALGICCAVLMGGHAATKRPSLKANIEKAVKSARTSILSGAALKKLDALVEWSAKADAEEAQLETPKRQG